AFASHLERRVRTTGAICLILALSDQSSLCKIAATTMSAQKKPLTALSTAKTAAAVKMIIVPSNNQTFRVGSTIRVITPTSGQAPGQAIKLENEERKLDVNMQAVEKEFSGIIFDSKNKENISTTSQVNDFMDVEGTAKKNSTFEDDSDKNYLCNF
ncbi:hypothetical protein TYRP_009545, partial [Tyrophagus putrescentiae]